MRLIAAVAVALVTSVTAVACSEAPSAPPATVTGGDRSRGLVAIQELGCTSCHVVPGVRRAEQSWIAPPLTKFARRGFIAGILENNEENLVRWIVDPQGVDPETAMPDLDVSPLAARDIAAYLYSLR